MIVRPFTILTGLAFVLSGAMMFVVKHQSQMLDSQLSDVNEATQQDEQSIRVLQAQWALEADPSRLAALAAQFTGLQPMKPGQLMTMAALGSALPAPGAKPPGANPDNPVPAMPQLAAAAPVQVAASASVAAPAAAPVPVQTVAAPVQAAPVAAQAVIAPVRTAAVQPAVKPAAAPEHVASVSEIAPVAAPPRHHAVPERVARETPVHRVVPPHHDGGSSVYLADASGPAPVHATSVSAPMGAPVMAVRAVAAPAPAPLDNGGSMLGMAQGDAQ